MDSLLALQQLVGAAERLAARDRSGNRETTDWLGAVEQARDRLARRPFEALPIPSFRIREGGKERVVSSPVASDRIIEEALMPVVSAAVEPLLLPSVHAYRRGRSTFTGAQDAVALLARGLHEVALLDVSDFFPSVDREALVHTLTGLLEEPLVAVIGALAAAPLQLDGEIVRRGPRGLPLGRSLSPVLANLALVPADREMEAAGAGYLRYGDDLFLAAPTTAERDAFEARLAAALLSLGLRLREGKARRFHYDGAPFLYLGHAIDHRGLFERVAERRLQRMAERKRSPAAEPAGDLSAIFQPNRRSRTLYVTEPGLYLRSEQGRIVVKRGPETVREVPIRRLDRVLVLAGVSMSSGFLTSCISQNVPVLFFVGRGRAYGSLVTGGMPNPLRLRAQYDLVSSSERRLALARNIVDAKLQAMLRKLSRQPAAEEQRARIGELAAQVGGAPDTGVLRGFECSATRAWYEALALRITNEAFRFERRSKQPPRDPVNSLLSFTYSLVFGEMQTALLAHGLDPHPGLLHDLRPRHPALASDLIEPYRVLLADSFVLWLVNRNLFKEADFERQSSGAVYLAGGARRRFLESFEEYLARPIGPPGAATPRQLIDGAALAMLRVVLGETGELTFPFRADEIPPDGVEDEEETP